MKKILKLSLVAAFSIALSSCVKESMYGGIDTSTNKETQVILQLKTPSEFSGAKSRSLSYEDENTIEEIDVLVFDKNNILTVVKQGSNVQNTPNSASGSFSVTLMPSGLSETSNLVVLANAHTIIGARNISTMVGESYSNVIAAIWDDIDGAMYPLSTPNSGQTIPMWGETGQLMIAAGMAIQTVQLARSVARIDVGVGAPTRDALTHEYKWNGNDKNGNAIPFDLTEVYVIQPNKRYAVIPIATGKPTIPANTQKFTVSESESEFKFTATSGSIQRNIYVPESDIFIDLSGTPGDARHTERMAIVVGGIYNNSGSTTYYRIDFAKNRTLLNVLRNHLYQFNIMRVSGAGYADVETAYKSLSMNMTAEILEWDETDMGDIIFDGQYYFSIEKSEVIFSPMGKETHTLKIKTNVEGFEMWEQGDAGSETMQLKAGVTENYTNTNYGFKYTLTHNSQDSYSLQVEATKHNVSNVVSNRLNKWKIKLNNLSAALTVKQEYTVLDVSYINAKSHRIYPEGTTSENQIPIEIMALKPVDIQTSESWIDLGDISGLTNSVDGLYSARLDVSVPCFPVDANNTSGIRTGTITITPTGEDAHVFTITQEMPIFKFSRTPVKITRQTGVNQNTYVDITTNILWSDFRMDEESTEGDDAWRIKHKSQLVNVDKNNPRSARLFVDVDMTTSLPISIKPFSKSFESTIDDKYNLGSTPIVKFEVSEIEKYFNGFWFDATIPPLTVPYRFPEEKNAKKYAFPWQTTSATLYFNVNKGVAYSLTNVTGKGTAEAGTEVDKGEYNQIPYVFTFNKQDLSATDSYKLCFESTSDTTEVKFELGSQVWKRTPATTDVPVSYKGYTEGAPYEVRVTSNIKWKAEEVGSTNQLTMRLNSSGAWGASLERDDRATGPKEVVTYNPETDLVTTDKIGFTLAPYATLNTISATRDVKVQFSNESFDAGGTGGVAISNDGITFKQYAPVLNYSSGVPSSIPYYGGPYVIKVNTNIQSWGVRVYQGNDNTGTLLGEKAFGQTPPISDKEVASERTIAIDIPRYNASTNRMLSFYVYHTESDITEREIKVGSAEQKWEDYVTIAGVKWKMGHLIATGANSCTVGAPTDGGLYFQYGGLIGYKGGANGSGEGTIPKAYDTYHWGGASAYSDTHIAVTPSQYTSRKDIWPNFANQTSGRYGYYYFSNFTTKFADFSKQANGNNPAQGIGDPCKHYLGGDWRLPTNAELIALIGISYNEDSGIAWSTSGVQGRWTNSGGPLGTTGAWFGPNSRTGTPNLKTDLFLPEAGRKFTQTGVHNIAMSGFWTSSNGLSGGGGDAMHTQLTSSSLVPQRSGGRSTGMPIRCVKK